LRRNLLTKSRRADEKIQEASIQEILIQNEEEIMAADYGFV
jgi:hypothetical protein